MKLKLTILIIAILLSSCRTKQKSVERQSTALEIEASEITDLTTEETISLHEVEAIKEKRVEASDNLNEEIEADSTGTVTVEYEETNTGYKRTYKGVKSVTISSEKQTDEIETSTTKETTANATATENKKDESFIKVNQETDGRKTNVEIKSTSTWFWLLLAIIVIVYFLQKRFDFF